MDVYDLKKRAYIGTTSMEAEVSLLMANQALAAPGKYVYDPFGGPLPSAPILLTRGAWACADEEEDARQLERGRCCSHRPSLAPWRSGATSTGGSCAARVRSPAFPSSLFAHLVR